jgi:hypothetical protein
MKTLIGLVIGIAVTAAIIVPIANSRTDAKLEAQRVQIELETAQAEIEALKAAQTPETAPEPQEVKGTPEPAKIEEITSKEVGTEETVEVVEVKAETIPEPTVTSEVKPTTSPQVNEETQPETWWEDGKQYTMINGYKAYIAPEGNNQIGYFDWENSPQKDVPGPFN